MKMQIETSDIPSKILFIRGKRVMLDKDLAELYNVPTKVLNQAVSRNRDRFPEDFMFQLTAEEYPEALRSQIVTLKQGQHRKYLPYAFTEQGVAMLSSVLRSKQAIRVNIQIMRTFTRLRALILDNQELRTKIEDLEEKYDTHFSTVFEAIKKLLELKEEDESRLAEEANKQQIGFRVD